MILRTGVLMILVFSITLLHGQEESLPKKWSKGKLVYKTGKAKVGYIKEFHGSSERIKYRNKPNDRTINVKSEDLSSIFIYARMDTMHFERFQLGKYRRRGKKFDFMSDTWAFEEFGTNKLSVYNFLFKEYGSLYASNLVLIPYSIKDMSYGLRVGDENVLIFLGSCADTKKAKRHVLKELFGILILECESFMKAYQQNPRTYKNVKDMILEFNSICL